MVVLPVRRGAVEPVVVVEAHPCLARVDATRGAARAPRPHEVHVLVVPDRDTRVDAEDQIARDPGLPFREWTRARVVDVPGSPAAEPLGRPVGVEVDTPSVLAHPAGVPVRVEIRDDPEVETGMRARQCVGDWNGGAFDPVNATEEEHAGAVWVSNADRHDRPSQRGTPELERGAGRNTGRRAEGAGDQQADEGGELHISKYGQDSDRVHTLPSP